jgi:hypothetical protein
MGEPTALSLLDERTVPPGAFWVFGRVGFNNNILNERQIDISLAIVRE